jgi:UDP-N-acetylmuramoyl-L-alanyl-D-glutamate--2,6-diaminopimelate ligase
VPVHSFDLAWDEPIRRPVSIEDLAAYVAGAHAVGHAMVEGVVLDSREVRPGDLFVALPGAHRDGTDFVTEAIARGARAVLAERVLDVTVAQLVVPSAFAALGPTSAAVYGFPTERLEVVGVTGTNGKTTTAELIRSALSSPDHPVAQLGTTGIYLGFDLIADTELSTPQAPDLQRLFAGVLVRGARRAVMEVTSHGLHQHRVDGTRFRVGVFLNLSPEHLDYHRTMENYYQAKRRLFDAGRCEFALVCLDDEWGARLASELEIPVRTFSTGGSADVVARVESRGLAGVRVVVPDEGGSVVLHSPLVGRVNGANITAAYLVARHLGVDVSRAKDRLEACPAPPGRFEVVTRDEPFVVASDYAHTPDALGFVIDTAREISRGRVRLVFGARGGRYVDKRPLMAEEASRADEVWLTTDSPGDEDPRAIARQVREGFRGDVVVHEEPDRSRAIHAALRASNDGDVVVMTGRGPEPLQRFGAFHVHLDDRVEARLALDALYPPRDDGTVSVVVWARDHEDSVERALVSALAQTRPPREVLLVDDGSGDATVDVARRVGVRVIRGAARGRSFCRNLGAARALAPWIAFLDASDLWHPEKIESQWAAMSSRGALASVTGWSSSSTWTPRDVQLSFLEEYQEEWGERRASTLLLRRDVFGAVGGFDANQVDTGDGRFFARLGERSTVVALERDLVRSLARRDL